MSVTLHQPPAAIPPLVQGDRLTRDEFERRCHAMSHVRKAELIDGIVDMPFPVSANDHGSSARHQPQP